MPSYNDLAFNLPQELKLDLDDDMTVAMADNGSDPLRTIDSDIADSAGSEIPDATSVSKQYSIPQVAAHILTTESTKLLSSEQGSVDDGKATKQSLWNRMVGNKNICEEVEHHHDEARACWGCLGDSIKATRDVLLAHRSIPVVTLLLFLSLSLLSISMAFKLVRQEVVAARKSVALALACNQIFILTETKGYNVDDKKTVSTQLQTVINECRMTDGAGDGFTAEWLVSPILLLGISLVISSLFMMVLVEKQSHANLLAKMLPCGALRKIQRGQTVVETYDMVTILFSDIVGYTTMSAEMRPIQVMKMLNDFYCEMDKIIEKTGVFKVETIGDAYMVAGGLPGRCTGPEGAEKVARFALEAITLASTFRTEDGAQLSIRCGMNSGPVVAGVIGTKRPQYTIFGDTVNAAARMESTSQTMQIQCSDMTCCLLRDAPTFSFKLEARGEVEVKGKGMMHTWWINDATKRRPVVLDSAHFVAAPSCMPIRQPS